MPEIVIATRNHHKYRELAALLRLREVRWRSLEAFPDLPAVEERGRTFRANALKKARLIARATGCWALADDSGLEVAALRQAPGVRSARFSGRHGNDHANNAKLLRLLRGVPDPKRDARYRCVLALASPETLLAVAEGTLRGRIAQAPRGRGGFGYDPVFLLPRLTRTVAQLSAAAKNRLSHRAKAAQAMRRLLKRLVASEG
ncbi:MAG: RdgB/HAM1 family non-canonical purine NTP pyrophosphatase [Candidatus Omnitrophica bacterium]|nr:RdgB/HAM1 family non-canonical purine NTP pyrophosphatase [Candidatus Omnitrophota bacterium]